MSNENIEKKVSYEQLVCGAFLRFGVLDTLDLSILARKLHEKYNIQFEGSCTDTKHGMGRIIRFNDDGTFKFLENVNLNTVDKKTGKPVREVLREVAGPEISKFFGTFDIETYEEEKKKMKVESHDKFLEEANVLLVSEREEDYEALVRAGFKHINYFKSWVLADKFFKVHHQDEQKYHIFIEGEKTIRAETDIEKHISSFCNWSNRIQVRLYAIDEPDYFKLSTSIYDRFHHCSYSVKSDNYETIIDAILDNAMVNKTSLANREDVIINDFDKEHKNRQSYPNIAYGLKVLYLQSYGSDYLTDEVAKAVGLDYDKIDYHPDHNFTLERHVDEHLGEYDIIVVSHSFSKHILDYVEECNRQCEYTGKNMVLLCTYDTDGIKASNDTERQFVFNGSKIKLRYKVAGPDAKGLEFEDDNFIVLNGEFTPHNTLIQKATCGEDKMSNTYAILCAVIDKYNKALSNARGYGLNESYDKIRIPTTSEFTAKYNAKIEAKRKYQDYDETPVHEFDDMMYQVGLYLLNKENGLIDEEPDGIRIDTWGDTIKIWNTHKGKEISSIMVRGEDSSKYENARLFYLQINKDDGRAGNILPVGFYTKAHFEEYPNNPFFRRVPDEKEMEAIKFIEEKVIAKLSLVNLKGLVNQFGRNSQIVTKEAILKLLNGKKD